MRRDLRRLLAPRSIAIVGGAPAERVVRQCLNARLRRADLAGPSDPHRPRRRAVLALARCAARPCPTPSSSASTATPRSRQWRRSRSHRCRRRRLLRIGLRRVRRGRPAAAISSTPPAMCRSSARTATATSTRSTGSRSGPTSTACTRFERGVAIVVAERQRRPSTSPSSNAACASGPSSRSATRPASASRTASTRSSTTRGSPRSDCSSKPCATRSASPRLPDARTRRVCRSSRCRPGGRAPARGSPRRTRHRSSGTAAAYDALFARYGVATVDTPAELIETLKLLDNGGRLTRPADGVDELLGRRSVAGRRSRRGTGLEFEPFTERAPQPDRSRR